MLVDKRIFNLIKGVKGEILIKILLEFLLYATYIGQAFIMGSLIGGFYRGVEIKAMTVKFITIIALMLLRFILMWFMGVFAIKIMGNVRNKLRARLLDKISRLGPGFLFLKRSGKLESTLVSGIDYLQGYLIMYIPQIIVVVAVCSFLLLYLFNIHWVLSGIGLLSIIFCLIAPRVFGKVMQLISNSHWTSYGELNSDLVDGVQGMITLKSFNRGEDFGKNIKNRMKDLFVKTMKSLKINLLDVFVINLFSACGTSLILGVGAILFATGQIEASSLAVILFLANELFRPVNKLSDYFHQGFMGMSSSKSLYEILDVEDFVKFNGEKLPAKVFDELMINKLSFKYPETEKFVLKDINIKIHNNERVAIVGESGSGKTSLIYLLERFFDPSMGNIFYDGEPISHYNLEEYRRLISIVSQNTYLFTGTIRENLLLANPDSDDRLIKEACKKAAIDDDIMQLTHEYDSFVEEGGKNFSGGQRQRISLARAILKDAPILILDEATSSIDIRTEKKIQEALNDFTKNKTLIVVAHRLNTIKNVDKIYVLDEGEIAEEGSHDELLKKRGIYFNLCKNQTQLKQYKDGEQQ